MLASTFPAISSKSRRSLCAMTTKGIDFRHLQTKQWSPPRDPFVPIVAFRASRHSVDTRMTTDGQRRRRERPLVGLSLALARAQSLPPTTTTTTTLSSSSPFRAHITRALRARRVHQPPSPVVAAAYREPDGSHVLGEAARGLLASAGSSPPPPLLPSPLPRSPRLTTCAIPRVSQPTSR